MSQLAQTELRTSYPPLRFSGAISLWQLAILAMLSLWLYWPTLTHLVRQWGHDQNFSHGFFVPLFSAFVLWQARSRLSLIQPRPSWSGLLVLAVALCVLLVGQMGAELYLSRCSLLLVVAGLIILFWGWNFFRATLFPWAFLLLMIPIPSILFNHITIPLQFLASRMSAEVLQMLRVPVSLEGNILSLAAIQLEVADACSGVRSLLSLFTLSIIYAYLLEKRLWVRWVLGLASVPIAIAANSVRIVGTGLVATYWDADKAEGYFHASWGILVFVVSLLMFIALHGLIRIVFSEHEKSRGPEEGSN